MAENRTYTVKSSRLESAFMVGMHIAQNQCIALDEEATSHHIFLKKFDSFENDTTWGRLRIKKSLADNLIMVTNVVALNQDYFIKNEIPVKIDDFLLDEEIPLEQKKQFFKYAKAKQIIHHSDMLLYEKQGRYCWIYIEVIGQGQGEISQITILQPGDIFMQTFPEIYQDENSFFHRYMSVFSSIYVDFRERISDIPNTLTIENMPQEHLIYFAQWFGLNIGENFFEEPELRELVGELYQLNKIKGTKSIIEKCVKLISKSEPEITENNGANGEAKWDLSVRIDTPLTYVQEKQIRYLVQEFKPVGAKINLIFTKKANAVGIDTQLL